MLKFAMLKIMGPSHTFELNRTIGLHIPFEGYHYEYMWHGIADIQNDQENERGSDFGYG